MKVVLEKRGFEGSRAAKVSPSVSTLRLRVNAGFPELAGGHPEIAHARGGPSQFGGEEGARGSFHEDRVRRFKTLQRGCSSSRLTITCAVF